MLPEPGEYQYFLGIGLPRLESKFFAALKKYYHLQHHLTSPPHITLKPPFIYPNQKLLIDKLTAWSETVVGFKLVFQKVGSFTHRKYATVFFNS